MAVRQRNLQEILALHRQRYPLMEPEDYGKLLYQNEFGPEHMVDSPQAVLEQIAGEWEKEASSGTGEHVPLENPEEIGNHLYRFHLTGGYDPAMAAPLLARLFYLTAEQHHGSAESLEEKLAWLEQYGQNSGLCAPALKPWLKEYRRAGCPALSHSAAFRQAYAPHYRILRDEYAIYFPLLYEVEKRLLASKPVLMAIDGPCGGGKSSLAALLAELFPCRVLHMDDYYLPLEQRAPGWEETPCGNMDLERFLKEALLPATRGEPIACRPYNCRKGQLSEAELLPAAPLTVVEGSYSQHPLLTLHYDFKVFLYCRPEEQLARLERRESARLEAYRQRWIPLEKAYYQTFRIVSRCDLCFDNTPYFV